MTYLTLGGAEKTVCKTGDVAITVTRGHTKMHGPLSWTFGSSLQNNLSGALWSDILHEMTELIRLHRLDLEFYFHGSPTAPFHRQ